MPTQLAKPKADFEGWLESMYVPEPNSGCWIWLGARTLRNYPILQIEGMSQRAHRAVYEFYHGKVAHNLVIDHLCRNTLCVNPKHLEPVTSWINVKRGRASPPVLNAIKTHCINGHLFDETNTHIVNDNRGGEWRYCRSCGRERARKYIYSSGGTMRTFFAAILFLAFATVQPFNFWLIRPLAEAQAATINASLSWTDNSNNETGFSVERGAAIAGPFAAIGSTLADIATFVDAWLAPGNQYLYRILAFNLIGSSGSSNVACVTTPNLPLSPGNVTVVVTVTP